jgi:hypothetical protein
MTQIFKDYLEFTKREDKKVNGVSPEFANENPEWEKQNETNEGCWNCSGCSRCSDCYRCSDCSDCSRCSRCSDCSGCSDWIDNNPPIKISEAPIIENIHQKVLAAVSAKDAFDMSTWHTCDTTHCRAGWVVHLAGEQGYLLEKHTSTEFAAMIIYKKSSPIRVSPTRFFESNEVAMADIIRCAEEEKVLHQTK